MDPGTVQCSGRSEFSLLVNVVQYVGREGSQVTLLLRATHNIRRGGIGLPLKSGSYVML